MTATIEQPAACVIQPARRQAAGFAVFFAVLTVSGVIRAVTAQSPVGVVIVLLAGGLPALLYTRNVVRRGPALVVTDDVLEDRRSGSLVRWSEVDTAYAYARQGAFDRYHHLVLVTRRTDPEVELSVDQLALPWREVIELIEERSGRAIAVRQR
jgi:hypothetical protein